MNRARKTCCKTHDVFRSYLFANFTLARMHHNYSHSAKPEDVYKFLNAGYGVHDVYVYDKRNNYQYPNYHRLDLSVRFKKQKSNGVRTLTLGVINAYNRQNPYTVYYRYNNKELQIHQKSLFPVLPSFSWKYKWGDKI